MQKKTRDKQKMAKTLAKKQTDSTYPKSLIRIFINNSLLLRDGVSRDSIQARFITGQGANWVNPNEIDSHRIITN